MAQNLEKVSEIDTSRKVTRDKWFKIPLEGLGRKQNV